MLSPPSLEASARVHTLSLSKLRAEVIDKLDYKRCLSSFRVYSRSLTCEVKINRKLKKIGIAKVAQVIKPLVVVYIFSIF